MSNTGISRRSFLGAAASTAAFTIVPAHVLGGPRHRPPSEKLNIAGIGIGGMGAVNLGALESENIVALCDVDHEYAGKTFKKYPGAKVYADYREMLEKQKDIDAVLIATPDHTHAVITMAALRAGKHVYCQKPLTHDVFEARQIAKAAREAKVITQMGIQGHSGEGARLICEWIADGAIGEVREVDAWCSDSYYPWGHAFFSPKWSARPAESPAVPATMNWDLWIGPASMRPYHPAYHPCCWRAWVDFGTGWMCDRGCHTFDPIVWALQLGAPTSVDAATLGQTDETHCVAGVMTFHFPAREVAVGPSMPGAAGALTGDKAKRVTLPPVKVTWYDGLRAPRPVELEEGRKQADGDGGVIFHGSKGKLMCGTYGNSPRLIPESRMRDYKRPEPTLPRVPDSHEMDWVRACKAGQPAGAHFDYSGPLTEICLLGNIAKRVGGRIEWDAENMKVTTPNEANQFVKTPYREGWSLG